MRLLHPWNFPGKSTRVGCHFLLQGIYPTQGLNLGLPHCRQTLYLLSYQGRLYTKLTPYTKINSKWIKKSIYKTINPKTLRGKHRKNTLWHCCGSVIKWCPKLCNSVDCSRPGFSVLHYCLQFAKTHVHWIGDAIQPSHLLLPPSPPAFNLS